MKVTRITLGGLLSCYVLLASREAAGWDDRSQQKP